MYSMAMELLEVGQWNERCSMLVIEGIAFTTSLCIFSMCLAAMRSLNGKIVTLKEKEVRLQTELVSTCVFVDVDMLH